MVEPRLYYNVYAKFYWDDPWHYCPYIEPVDLSYAVAPGVGSARFALKYGNGIWEDGSSLIDGLYAETFQRMYMQVRVSENQQSAEDVLWTGWVPAEQFDLKGLSLTADAVEVRTIDQVVIAQDFKTLLDTRIVGGWVGPASPVWLSETPVFNRRYSQGPGVIGNRSSSQVSADGADLTYVFSADGEPWTNYDILEYLLTHCQAEGGPGFELSVSAEIQTALDTIVGVYDLGGRSLREAINLLLPRGRGFVWWISFNYDLPAIEVQTALDADMTIGSVTIPANDDQVSLDLWTDERVAVTVTQDGGRFYDDIIVRGEKMKSCFTVSIEDGSLEPGWSSSEETAYQDAAKNTTGYGELSEDEQAEKNDIFRTAERFERVYVVYRLPASFSWTVTRGGVSGIVVAPMIDEDGEFVEPEAVAAYWNVDKQIHPQLPLEEGADYSSGAGVDKTPDDSEPEYRSVFVVCKDHNDNYVPVDKNPVTPATVRCRQREMSLDIKTSPNHAMASGGFDDAEPTAYDYDDAGMDYNDLVATVFMTTDQVVEVSTQISGEGAVENRRQLVIRVPGAELWYIADHTVVDIKDDGTLVEYSGDNVLRDDRDSLRSVLAAAATWYGVQRNKIMLRIDDIDAIVKLGQLIQNVRVVNTYQPEIAGTIVTNISMNFRNRTTFIQTDFIDLDVLAGWRSEGISSTPTLASAGRQIERLEKEIRDTREAIGRKPDRVAVGGGGGSGGEHIFRRAQTTAAWTEGSSIVVNFLDSDGAEATEGDEYGVTIYFMDEYSASLFPKIANDQVIPVCKDINDLWYCPFSFVEAVEVDDLMADFEIDTSTRQFKMKKRENIYVLDGGALGSFGVIHTGDDC